jgi:hypothetical protein
MRLAAASATKWNALQKLRVAIGGKDAAPSVGKPLEHILSGA